MGTLGHHFKYIVTALVLTVGHSIPAIAADVDDLMNELSQADPQAQGRIASRIVSTWENSGSPSMDLLLRRGKDALDAGDLEAALDHFSALIDHAPEFSEGYNGRATAYFLLGMTGPALADLRTLLVQEPRHFGGMRGVAVIMEDIGRPAEALEIYRAVLQIYPTYDGVADAVERLELALEGQAL
tara:strand:+ start:11333 stop:11887 length:555 start_codon:yes stop_codon:yes gene_type:complete